MRRFLDPTNDLTFKRLFGTEKNKGILIAFLNAIFEGVHPKIEDVSFQTLNQYPEITTLAQSIVDVSCRDSEGNQVIIEMQCYGDSDFLQRACFYASRAYISQKTKKNVYDELNPVRFLAILERSLFPEDVEYLSHNKILNIHTHECHIKQFSYSFLELSKIDKTLEESKTLIEKWVYFFKCAPKTTEEELKIIARDYPPVREAYHALEQYHYTKEELEEYYRLDRNANAIATSLSDERKKGKAEGLAEGEAKGKAEATREMVMRLHQQGVDKNIIATAAQVSLEEVEKILK